jgi:DNA-binding MarR family transcriptional regulator
MDNSLGKSIGYMSRLTKKFLRKNLATVEFKDGQMYYLKLINENPGICNNELTKIMNVNKSTTTRAIKKLLNFEYIYHIHDEKDHRIVRFYPTEKGEAEHILIRETFSKWSEVIEHRLTEEDKMKFLELIAIMIENAEVELEKENER